VLVGPKVLTQSGNGRFVPAAGERRDPGGRTGAGNGRPAAVPPLGAAAVRFANRL